MFENYLVVVGQCVESQQVLGIVGLIISLDILDVCSKAIMYYINIQKCYEMLYKGVVKMLTLILKTTIQIIVLAVVLDVLGRYFIKSTLLGKLIMLVYKDSKFILKQLLKICKSVYKTLCNQLSSEVQKEDKINNQKKKCVNEESNIIDLSKYTNKQQD